MNHLESVQKQLRTLEVKLCEYAVAVGAVDSETHQMRDPVDWIISSSQREYFKERQNLEIAFNVFAAIDGVYRERYGSSPKIFLSAEQQEIYDHVHILSRMFTP